MDIREEALKMRRKFHGLLEIRAKVPLATRTDLSIAYTPGVAEPCKEIKANPDLSFELTCRGNVVGIVNAKHGGIDAMLENLLNSNLGASGVFINGVDPNAVFREILIGMKKNLNLGIGYAIKTEEIKNLIQNIY